MPREGTPSPFAGVYTVMVTPFNGQGAIDLDSVTRLTEKLIESGVDGLLALGVMGEAARLTADERTAVMDRVLKTVHGRVPVIIGASGGGTRAVIAMADQARDAGASGILVTPPPLMKPNDAAVYAFYADLAESVDIPLVVQDYPLTTGIDMSAALLVQLLREIPTACHIKLEDPPTPAKVSKILALADNTTPMSGGLGGLYLLPELVAGTVGVMTGFAYPEVLKGIYEAVKNGDMNRAFAIYQRYLPLLVHESQPGIGLGIRKAILQYRGWIDSAHVRAPGSSPDVTTVQALTGLLEHLEMPQGILDLEQAGSFTKKPA